MAEGRRLTHCRHCLGDGCPGDCLLGGGQCIHGRNGRRPTGASWRVLLTRRWWHRVLRGRAGQFTSGRTDNYTQWFNRDDQ